VTGTGQAAAQLLAGKRVLIVEDESLISMLLEDIVADLGGVVAASASRVSRALEIVNRFETPIDVAVLDVNVNGEEVFPIAQALAGRGVPFAFSTGYGNSGLPEPWRGRPTLQKPFTEDQVRSVLARALQAAPGAG
jgi:DNA-binding NtrC family response regulator